MAQFAIPAAFGGIARAPNRLHRDPKILVIFQLTPKVGFQNRTQHCADARLFARRELHRHVHERAVDGDVDLRTTTRHRISWSARISTYLVILDSRF